MRQAQQYRRTGQRTQSHGRPTYRGGMLVALSLLLGACVSGKLLQDRHHMSRLVVPDEGSELVFEASVGPDYPIDSEAGEAVRRDWIAQWLERERLCADGFEIIERTPIGPGADNPYRHDLRYRLRCTGR